MVATRAIRLGEENRMRTRFAAGRGLGGRATAVATCVLTALATVGVLAPPTSAVSVNQTFGVPDDRVLTVRTGFLF